MAKIKFLRQVQELNRVALPKEITDVLDIKVGDTVSITCSVDRIEIQKEAV